MGLGLTCRSKEREGTVCGSRSNMSVKREGRHSVWVGLKLYCVGAGRNNMNTHA